jgi:hypothetical protein
MGFWTVVISLLVKTFALPTALQMISTPLNSRPRGDDNETTLASAVDSLLALNLFVFKPCCWKRAALLHRYLAQNGQPTRIVFGVRKDDGGKLDGHAWLEAEAGPILEAAPPNYRVTYSFPSRHSKQTDT